MESLKVKSKSDKDERAYREFLERGKRLLYESKNEEEIAENEWMKEEAEDAERQIVEKLQRMELQDRLIDEEKQSESSRRSCISRQNENIKLRNDRVEEEKKKIQRLKALKQEVERLERRLQMRINEQIQQKDRFKSLPSSVLGNHRLPLNPPFFLDSPRRVLGVSLFSLDFNFELSSDLSSLLLLSFSLSSSSLSLRSICLSLLSISLFHSSCLLSSSVSFSNKIRGFPTIGSAFPTTVSCLMDTAVGNGFYKLIFHVHPLLISTNVLAIFGRYVSRKCSVSSTRQSFSLKKSSLSFLSTYMSMTDSDCGGIMKWSAAVTLRTLPLRSTYIISTSLSCTVSIPLLSSKSAGPPSLF